jgi:hypothetical protein
MIEGRSPVFRASIGRQKKAFGKAEPEHLLVSGLWLGICPAKSIAHLGS